jgi:hypothetical protein
MVRKEIIAFFLVLCFAGFFVLEYLGDVDRAWKMMLLGAGFMNLYYYYSAGEAGV